MKRLISRLEEVFRDVKSFVNLTTGSLVFRTGATRETWTDGDREAVETLRAIRDSPEELKKTLSYLSGELTEGMKERRGVQIYRDIRLLNRVKGEKDRVLMSARYILLRYLTNSRDSYLTSPPKRLSTEGLKGLSDIYRQIDWTSAYVKEKGVEIADVAGEGDAVFFDGGHISYVPDIHDKTFAILLPCRAIELKVGTVEVFKEGVLWYRDESEKD